MPPRESTRRSTTRNLISNDLFLGESLVTRILCPVTAITQFANNFINDGKSLLSGETDLPLLWARKEVYAWIRASQKTIDVRKGKPHIGTVATIQCGKYPALRLQIVKRETGSLAQIITEDNFKFVIPTAKTLKDAIDYLRRIYGTEEGIFTAYHLAQTKKQ